MSVQHKATSIKNKPKSVEELTAQGRNWNARFRSWSRVAGGASPAMQAAVMSARLTMNDEIKAGNEREPTLWFVKRCSRNEARKI